MGRLKLKPKNASTPSYLQLVQPVETEEKREQVMSRDLDNARKYLKEQDTFNSEYYTKIAEYIRRCLLLSDGAKDVFEEIMSWLKLDSSKAISQIQMQANLNKSHQHIIDKIEELKEKKFIKKTPSASADMSHIYSTRGLTKNPYVLLSEAIHTMRDNLFLELDKDKSMDAKKRDVKKQKLLAEISRFTNKDEFKGIDYKSDREKLLDAVRNSKKPYESAYKLALEYFCDASGMDIEELREETKEPVCVRRKRVRGDI